MYCVYVITRVAFRNCDIENVSTPKGDLFSSTLYQICYCCSLSIFSQLTAASLLLQFYSLLVMCFITNYFHCFSPTATLEYLIFIAQRVNVVPPKQVFYLQFSKFSNRFNFFLVCSF